MESVDVVKPSGEWTRKDKLNFLKVQRILSALGVFLSIILATNLFLINAQNSNPITKWFGIISVLLGVFSVLTLLWSIKQSSVIEQSQDSFASETDNNFSRAILILQINLLQFFALFFLLFNFAQEDLLNSFPDQKANQLRFEGYKSTIEDKSTWINLLSLIALAISAFTLFTASALANSTSTHRIAVYVFGLILLVVTFDELQQVRAVADAFKGLSIDGLENWSQIGLKYRGILSLVFLAGIYLANARRNRLAYLITGVFFLVVIGVTLGSTGQVFRDYRTVQAHFDNNCVLELGTLSSEVVDATSCGSKYIKRTDLKPENVCPVDTKTNPSLCYQGVGQCDASNLQQIWESSIVSDPRKTQYLACVDQRCCGDLNNYYSRFVLIQAAYAFAFVYFAFVLGSFAFQLSSKDKGDNLPRNRQYIFFGTFIVLFLVFVILLLLPFASAVPKNTNNLNLSTSTTALTVENSLERQIKFLQQQKFEQSLAQRQESYGQDGCTQFKSFFNDKQFAKLQLFTKEGTPDANVAKEKSDFNRLLNFDQLVLPADNFCQNANDCGESAGYVYLLELQQEKGKNVDFQFWSRERSDRYRIIDTESVRELIQSSSAATSNNRFFGVIGYSDVIDNILQGEQNSLFVCNVQDAATVTLNIRILKVNVQTFLQPTQTTTSGARILKMHKKDHAAATTTTGTTGSTTTTTTAAGLPTGDKLKLQSLRFTVYDLENGSTINNAQVRVWVSKTAETAEQTTERTSFLNTCELSKLTSQTSFQAITSKNGQAEFLFYYADSVKPTDAQKWTVYVYAEVPGNTYSVNCRRFSIPTLASLSTLTGGFDISLGRALQSTTSTRVVLEWDKLLIDQTKWEQTTNLNLFVTFQPESDSSETFTCHVGFTQTFCRDVQYNAPVAGLSSQSIDLKTVGAYNYLIYVQRFANTSSGNNIFNWFVKDSQAAKATLKYYASASSRPLQVVELFPASRAITETTFTATATQAASLQWCIKGKTTIKVQPVNNDLLSKTPFGIWGSTQWTDSSNSFPSSNTAFKQSDTNIISAC